MSLINDALKRASQSHREQPREANLESPMQPVPSRPSSKVPLIAGLSLVVIVGLAGFFFWQWWQTKNPATTVAAVTKSVPESKPTPATKIAPPPNPTPIPVVAKTPETKSVTPPAPVPAPVPVVVPTTVSSPAPVVPVAAVTPTATASAIISPAPAPAPLPPFPTIKLKAIFYRAKNPMALLNSRTLGIGEEIEGALVTKIESQKVTLEWKGQTKELWLDSQ